MAAGVFALIPSAVSAFEGNLVTCLPSVAATSVATFNPGLDCTAHFSKIAVKALFNGRDPSKSNPITNCTSNAAAPWADWATGKFASKITATDAALISEADVTVAAVTFGTCNFGGTPTSFGASGGGSITFRDATHTKVKGGSGSYYGKVAGDIATQSAQVVGLMIKGFAVGANVLVQVAIDLAGPDNGTFLSCNTGSLCPPDSFAPKGNASCAGKVTDAECCQSKTCTGLATPDACCTGAGLGCKGLGTCIAPASKLDLTTTGSKLSIDIVGNTLCTGPGAPFKCCTGLAAGNCGLYY